MTVVNLGRGVLAPPAPAASRAWRTAAPTLAVRVCSAPGLAAGSQGQRLHRLWELELNAELGRVQEEIRAIRL